MTAPIEEKHIITMNAVAQALSETFEGHGFCLLVFDTNTGTGRMNYIANVERADMLTAMKEFIAHAEGRVLEQPKTPQ